MLLYLLHKNIGFTLIFAYINTKKINNNGYCTFRGGNKGSGWIWDKAGRVLLTTFYFMYVFEFINFLSKLPIQKITEI